MSGRTKRILYRILDTVLWLAAALGVFLMLLLIASKEKEAPQAAEFIACGAFVLCILLKIPVLLHELGHLLFGLIAGMKPVSFRVSFLGGSTAGAIEMVPKNPKKVRGRFLCFALGGGIFNLLVGAVLLALFLSLPYHPALLFCGMFSSFSLYEGVRALIPAELPAGKTDGGVICGILRQSPEEMVMLRVLEVQGILCKGSFSAVPRRALFETPVVREDLPAFHALLSLRMQYLLALCDEKGAAEQLSRLKNLEEYFSEGEKKELERYERYFSGDFTARKEPLFGLSELEKTLEKRCARNAREMET